MAAPTTPNYPTSNPTLATDIEDTSTATPNVHSYLHDQVSLEVNAIGADLIAARNAEASLDAKVAAMDAATAAKVASVTAGTNVTVTGTATNPIINSTAGGTVTGVTGTAPIVSSGGTAPAISIPAATNAVAGHATAAHITALEANNAKVSNATHTGDVTGATALTIAANAVTTAKIADANVTAAKLANTSVTAGSYGSSSLIPSITIDAQGRITSATTNAVSGGTATAQNYILVAASTAPADVKAAAGATYTCDGINDEVQIQAALDAISTLIAANPTTVKGGEVVLSAGTFNIGATGVVGGTNIINVPQNTTLRGTGGGIWGSSSGTILKYIGNAPASPSPSNAWLVSPIVKFLGTDSDTRTSGQRVENIGFDGQHISNITGLYIHYANSWHLDQLNFWDCTQYGIYVHGGSDSTIKRTRFDYCGSTINRGSFITTGNAVAGNIYTDSVNGATFYVNSNNSSQLFTKVTMWSGPRPGASGTLNRTTGSTGDASLPYTAFTTNPTFNISSGSANAGAVYRTSGAYGAATTAATWAAGTTTLTIGSHILSVGQTIYVTGLAPAALNGMFTITAKTSTTVSYALASNPGTITDQIGMVNKSTTYTVANTISGSTFLTVNAASVQPSASSGTLDKVSGTGDATITFSAIEWNNVRAALEFSDDNVGSPSNWANDNILVEDCWWEQCKERAIYCAVDSTIGDASAGQMPYAITFDRCKFENSSPNSRGGPENSYIYLRGESIRLTNSYFFFGDLCADKIENQMRAIIYAKLSYGVWIQNNQFVHNVTSGKTIPTMASWIEIDSTEGANITNNRFSGGMSPTTAQITWTATNDMAKQEGNYVSTFADPTYSRPLVSGTPSTVTFAQEITAIANGGTAATTAAGARTNLGLGTAATKDVPATGDATTAQVVYGTDTRLTDARTPTTHNQSATTITSGTLDIARIPTGSTSTTVAIGNDSRLSDSRTPTGTAGGDLVGTYPNPTLTTSGVSAGTYGASGTQHAQVVVDAKGRVTSAANVDNTFVAYGGLVSIGHSYTQYGPSGGTSDSFANWTHRLAAALNISPDEVFLWGKAGAQASTASCGDTATESSGTGLVLRHLYPNHIYSTSLLPAPTSASKSLPALFTMMYGINEVARAWASTETRTVPTYKHGMRTMVSRARASEVHDSRDSTNVYSGFATTVTSDTIQTGPSYRKTVTNGNTLTITLPADFAGGTVGVCFLGCTGNGSSISSAINSSVTTIPLSTGYGDTYAQFINGDVLVIDAEQMLITAGGGTTSLTVTRGYNGTTAASHSAFAGIALPMTTACVNWSGTAAGMSGTTYLAGQGTASSENNVRSRIPVTKRWALTAADAGKTIIATAAGITGNEDVSFDSWWVEDPSPPTVLLVNQFRSAFPSPWIFFGGTVETAINAVLPALKTEFDDNVQVVDLATIIGNETECTTTASVTSGQTSIAVTLTSGTESLIGPGSVLRFADAAGQEEVFCTAISGTGTSRTLTVTRGFNGTTAAAHTAMALYDVRYVCSDRVHPSDEGHTRIAAAVIQTLTGLTRTYTQIAAGAGYGANRNQSLRDGYYIYTRGTRSTFGGGAQNSAYAVPIYIPQPCVITTIGCENTTSVASSVARLGLYRESQNGKPGQLIFDAGTVATTANGAKEITGLWAPVKAGWYWTVLVPQTAAAPTYRSINALTIPYTISASTVPSGASPNTQGLSCTLVTGALPLIWNTTGVEAFEANVPAIWMKISTPVRDG